MECLRGYIGLSWCGADTAAPASGLYLNDLPGISFRQLTAIADEEQKNAAGALADIETRAILRTQTALTGRLNKRQRIFNLKHSYNLSRVVDLDSTSVPSDDGLNLCGFTARMRSSENDVPASHLASIYIQTLSYYAHADDVNAEVDFYIFDLITSDELWTKTVTLASGWNTIEVNQVFTGDFTDNPYNIFCCFNASQVTTCYTKEVSHDVGEYQARLRFKGASTATLPTATLSTEVITEGTNSFGLSGVLSVRCRWDALVCQNKELFKTVYLNALGVETMIEQLHTSRLNGYSTVSVNRAKELKEYYAQSLEKEADIACEGIYIDLNDVCVECNETYKIIEGTP